MLINVAGAGAGKTTEMASRIEDIEVSEGKVVYCLAFTNTAVENINRRIAKVCCNSSHNIKVSTIHSFLYSQIIQPYYHLIYGVRYQRISTLKLPSDHKLRNRKISNLKQEGILHQSCIPQSAKWIVGKKSNDNKKIKEMRKQILEFLSRYCQAIIIDEAQDIDNHMYDVLIALNNAGIELELYGDPKQDIRGHNLLRRLISENDNGITSYLQTCYRCPQIHLNISNLLASDREKQIADQNNLEGSIVLYFESQTDVSTLMETGDFGLVYISKTNKRYTTHKEHNNNIDYGEIERWLETAIEKKHESMSCLEIRRKAYFWARKIKSDLAGEPLSVIFEKLINEKIIENNKENRKSINNFCGSEPEVEDSRIVVRSIESIKGLEADRCLFILTSDLAAYLFGEKNDDNKMKHLLYVALTRSRDNLSVLITTEVEEKYGKNRIQKFLESRAYLNE